ncbi:MAG: hypothetical protein ACAI44_38410 [Candidatus Sericytochromatia bacterium]
MKKVLFALAAMTALTAACQQSPQPFVNAASRLRAAAAVSPHHPDFLRKLRNPAAYRFTADANVSSICGPNDLQHVNSYTGSLGQPVDFVVQHKAAVGALAQGNPENSRKF